MGRPPGVFPKLSYIFFYSLGALSAVVVEVLRLPNAMKHQPMVERPECTIRTEFEHVLLASQQKYDRSHSSPGDSGHQGPTSQEGAFRLRSLAAAHGAQQPFVRRIFPRPLKRNRQYGGGQAGRLLLERLTLLLLSLASLAMTTITVREQNSTDCLHFLWQMVVNNKGQNGACFQ